MKNDPKQNKYQLKERGSNLKKNKNERGKIGNKVVIL
jgi:hypothetical protein